MSPEGKLALSVLQGTNECNVRSNQVIITSKMQFSKPYQLNWIKFNIRIETKSNQISHTFTNQPPKSQLTAHSQFYYIPFSSLHISHYNFFFEKNNNSMEVIGDFLLSFSLINRKSYKHLFLLLLSLFFLFLHYYYSSTSSFFPP